MREGADAIPLDSGREVRHVEVAECYFDLPLRRSMEKVVKSWRKVRMDGLRGFSIWYDVRIDE
jgi:hypothetical protein